MELKWKNSCWQNGQNNSQTAIFSVYESIIIISSKGARKMKKKIGIGILAIVSVVVVLCVVFYFFFPAELYKSIRNSEREAANLTEKSVQVDDHLVYYYEGGTGETVVLVHGFGAEKHIWAKFAKEITPKYHVIIPDLSGHGKTTQLQTANYNYQSQVDRLYRFIETLQLNNIHLAGNSMGGQIVSIFAAQYPQKLSSLALFDSAGVKSPEMSDSRKVLMKTGVNVLLVNNSEEFDRYIQYGVFKSPFIPGPVKKLLVADLIKRRPFNSKIWNDLLNYPVPLEPLLPKIEAPTIIFWGEADRIIHVSSVSVFERYIKNHQSVIIKECGHVPMLEKPQETAGLYLKFISQNSSAN
jgi:abhydrolase domain-containing protein 6